MDLDSAIYLSVKGTVTSLPVFIQNILNCVLKTNEDFMGSERYGGIILGWSIPLRPDQTKSDNFKDNCSSVYSKHTHLLFRTISLVLSLALSSLV